MEGNLALSFFSQRHEFLLNLQQISCVIDKICCVSPKMSYILVRVHS